MRIVFGKAAVTAALLFSLGGAFPARADQGAAVGEFQIIVIQEQGKTVGLNMAHGRGEDVRFFSNIAEGDVDWDEGAEGVRSGQYRGELDHVQLGVCAGGSCQSGFTTDVGGALR